MKSSAISLEGATRTEYLNVYKLILTPNFVFQKGDIFGLYTPDRSRSRHIIQFENITEGQADNDYLISYTLNQDLSLKVADHDVPIMIVEFCKYIFCKWLCLATYGKQVM